MRANTKPNTRRHGSTPLIMTYVSQLTSMSLTGKNEKNSICHCDDSMRQDHWKEPFQELTAQKWWYSTVAALLGVVLEVGGGLLILEGL